jgi:Ca2+-binding EF-hand superfamily protein
MPPPAVAGEGSGDMRPDVDRAEMRQRRAERMKQRLDTNGDGKITVDELKNATGRMKFDDPAAVDTDHDGIISDDELDAAMQARRDKWRDQRAAGNLGSGERGTGNQGDK